jgi:hypothetical protein
LPLALALLQNYLSSKVMRLWPPSTVHPDTLAEQ